jgi:hypothetical protein
METRTKYVDRDGITRETIVDDADPYTLRVYTEVQMDEVLESIKRDQERIQPGAVNKTLARVPLTIYEKSLIEGWDEADWKRWLNDPDNAALRVWKGRV